MKLKRYLLILVCAMLLAGCGGSASAEKTPEAADTTTQKEAKAIADIYDEITKNVELVSPFCWDEEFITNYYSIDVAELEEYVFSMSEDATSAEAVIIMKVKDVASVSALSDCLQMVVDEKKSEMENYLPEQFDIVVKIILGLLLLKLLY